MMQRAEPARADRRGLLARLRRDTAGNTMAIMAAALLPLCAFAGSAMDMARMYVVKVRLQQACDAGVLAGRKFLTPGVTANQALTGNTLTQANTFFTANLTTSWVGAGWYNANTPTFTPVTVADAQGNVQVAGTASAQVPMTLMQMFGFQAQTLNVACQASFSTPDTDVMFVLDTTGSMGCSVTRDVNSCEVGSGSYVVNNTVTTSSGSYVAEETSGGTNVSRIAALRTAVNAFYQTVSTTKDASTNVRYGFVPYTSTVNVGSLLYNLNPNYLVNSWSYQSRTATGDQVVQTTSSKTVAAANQAACNAYYSRLPISRGPNAAGDANAGYPNSGTATAYDPVWTPQNGNGSGSGNGNTPAKCTLNTDQVGPVWTYQGGVQYDVSNYLKGGSMIDPSRVDGSKTSWNGCIEERSTTAGTTSFDPANPPPDLDPNLMPTSDVNTRWRPMWSTVEYPREVYTGNANPSNTVTPPAYSDPSWGYYELYSCPPTAMPLFLPVNAASGASTVNSYVTGLRAMGYTYHDIGMIWATRMLSPTGLWASNNAWPAGRAAPARIIVFVTDGLMNPDSHIYGAYGNEFMDRRVTGNYFGSNDPSPNFTADPNYVNFHNQRFLAECSIAKSSPLNYDVWVVEVASASSPQLSQCASRPSQVLVGQTSAQLTAAFKQIAAQVAMLRVSN